MTTDEALRALIEKAFPRCVSTGNPCGTDTVTEGQTCPAGQCVRVCFVHRHLSHVIKEQTPLTPQDAERHASFTDANGRKVSSGDRVQYRDGRNGTMIAIFQDGSGYVHFDGDPGDTDVNWKHIAKWPEEEQTP